MRHPRDRRARGARGARGARWAPGWLLLLALPACLGLTCDPERIEELRRSSEGGLATPADHARVARQIAAVVADVDGAGTSMSQRMAQLGVPGLSLAVVNGSRVEWAESFGIRDLANATPVDRTTRFQAASISKPTTALAILQLVADGSLDLDAPVNDVLTSWQIPDSPYTQGNPVTLRHILSHTGGLNVPSFIGYTPGLPLPSLGEILRGQNSVNGPIEVVQPPGVGFLYSGGGYTVLAQVIEDVTGVPFGDWMRHNVLLPARMWRSTFEHPLPEPEIDDGLAMQVFGVASRPWRYPEGPAAGLWSTALDLARLVVAVQTSLAGHGELLDAATAEAMLTPEVFTLGASMGLGFFLVPSDAPLWFWHTGGNAGYESFVIGHRDAGVGVAVMTNALPGGSTLAAEVANAVARVHQWPDWDPTRF